MEQELDELISRVGVLEQFVHDLMVRLEEHDQKLDEIEEELTSVSLSKV